MIDLFRDQTLLMINKHFNSKLKPFFRIKKNKENRWKTLYSCGLICEFSISFDFVSVKKIFRRVHYWFIKAVRSDRAIKKIVCICQLRISFYLFFFAHGFHVFTLFRLESWSIFTWIVSCMFRVLCYTYVWRYMILKIKLTCILRY